MTRHYFAPLRRFVIRLADTKSHRGPLCHRFRSNCSLVLVSAFALASPADAKTRKHKNTAVTSETAYGPHYWGTNLVRRGPLYFSSVYLGDDPDPNIRFQILRDISGRFGGDSN
jgi:hypothetical protein